MALFLAAALSVSAHAGVRVAKGRPSQTPPPLGQATRGGGPKVAPQRDLSKYSLDYALGRESVKSVIVSDRIGVTLREMALLDGLGDQGNEKTCARYSVAAAARVVGVPLAARRVNRLAALIMRQIYGEIDENAQADVVRARASGDARRLAKARALRRVTKKDLEKTIRAPNEMGMVTDEQIFLARSLGLKVRDLDPDKTATNRWEDAVEGRGSFASFRRASVRLKADIAKNLKWGYPVVVDYGTDKAGHAVTLLSRGRNAWGRMVVKYYDSMIGGIFSVYWKDLFPRSALVIAKP